MIFYHVDTETTGLSYADHDVIEVSIYRLTDNVQKTWCMYPFNIESIDLGALRINGHKYEDICHKTKEGIVRYKKPNNVIVEIENWIAEDNVSASERCLVGHNVSFDKMMLEKTWRQCNAFDSFPFGRRMIDTMQIELVLDLAHGTTSESYSQNAAIKKYGVKNEKAHTAAADVLANKMLFERQMKALKQLIGK